MKKDKNWLERQAKKIEIKCLNKYNKSLSFTGIEMILRDGAVLENEIDTGMTIIDEEKYKENRKKYLKECKLI